MTLCFSKRCENWCDSIGWEIYKRILPFVIIRTPIILIIGLILRGVNLFNKDRVLFAFVITGGIFTLMLSIPILCMTYCDNIEENNQPSERRTDIRTATMVEDPQETAISIVVSEELPT